MSDPLDGSEDTIAGPDRAVSVTDATQAVEPRTPSSSTTNDGRLEVGSKIGRFEITAHLGSGGMGVVYLARDPELGRKLAIKLLRGHADGSAGDADRRRLKREAQAMAQLTHPNLVTVYDVGEHDGHVFIAMEYVSGGTLREWLASGERTWREILRTFIDAGHGLAAAHAAGIVHRDFKPDNTLVAGDGTVKVLDFGLASASGEQSADPAEMPTMGREDPLAMRLTQTGALLGTPAYMSPEQHHGKPTDGRTDQFSFAVALFEALYRTRPFVGETLAALVHAVLSGHVAMVERGEVPESVHAAILKALSVDPGQRFPNMSALLEAVDVRPESPTRDAPRAAEARKGGISKLAIGGGVAAVLALGIAGFVALGGDDPSTGARRAAEKDPPRSDTERHADAVPAEANAALMAILLAPSDDERAHSAEAYLDEYRDSGGKAREAIAEGMLGAALWRSSCETDLEGLCLSVSELDDGEARCAGDDLQSLTVHERDPELVERAAEHLDKATTLAAGLEPPKGVAEKKAFIDTIGMAMTMQIDRDLEAYLAIDPPRGLDFGKRGSAHFDLSSDAFRGWFDRMGNATNQLTQRYAKLKTTGSDYWIVVAAGRTGLVSENFANAILRMPIPISEQKGKKRAAYCDTLEPYVVPLRQQASEAFEYCSRRATKAKLSKGMALMCDERVARLSALSSDEIRAVFGKKMGPVKGCYEKDLKANPKLAGRVSMRFNIGPDGKVTEAATLGDSTLPESTQSCIVEAIKAMEFPAPGGKGIVVTYPLDFSP